MGYFNEQYIYIYINIYLFDDFNIIILGSEHNKKIKYCTYIIYLFID